MLMKRATFDMLSNFVAGVHRVYKSYPRRRTRLLARKPVQLVTSAQISPQVGPNPGRNHLMMIMLPCVL